MNNKIINKEFLLDVGKLVPLGPSILKYATKTQNALNRFVETEADRDLLDLADSLIALDAAVDVVKSNHDTSKNVYRMLEEAVTRDSPKVHAIIKKEAAKEPLPKAHKLYTESMLESTRANYIAEDYSERVENLGKYQESLIERMEAMNTLLQWQNAVHPFFNRKMSRFCAKIKGA